MFRLRYDATWIFVCRKHSFKLIISIQTQVLPATTTSNFQLQSYLPSKIISINLQYLGMASFRSTGQRTHALLHLRQDMVKAKAGLKAWDPNPRRLLDVMLFCIT